MSCLLFVCLCVRVASSLRSTTSPEVDFQIIIIYYDNIFYYNSLISLIVSWKRVNLFIQLFMITWWQDASGCVHWPVDRFISHLHSGWWRENSTWYFLFVQKKSVSITCQIKDNVSVLDRSLRAARQRRVTWSRVTSSWPSMASARRGWLTWRLRTRSKWPTTTWRSPWAS